MTEPETVKMYSKTWKTTDLSEYAQESQVKLVLENLFPYKMEKGKRQQFFDIKVRSSSSESFAKYTHHAAHRHGQAAS